MNEIFEKIQSMGIEDIFVSWETKMGALSREETIVLVAFMAVGLLLCLLGLKIVRAWAAAAGFFAGFIGAAWGVYCLEAGETLSLIAGGAAGLILAFLSAFFYRVGVFLTVFLSVSGIYFQIVQPRDYIPCAIGLAAAFLIAALSVKFVEVLTIFTTAVWGAMIAGTSFYQLVPLEGKLISILFCLIFAVLGIIVQLLFESRKRKRRNLEKAAEIRETHSTENEIEKARSFIDDFDGEPREEPSEDDGYTMEVVELDEDESEEDN